MSVARSKRLRQADGPGRPEKSESQKQDEEAQRLVRPSTEVLPERKDRQRNTVEPDRATESEDRFASEDDFEGWDEDETLDSEGAFMKTNDDVDDEWQNAFARREADPADDEWQSAFASSLRRIASQIRTANPTMRQPKYLLENISPTKNHSKFYALKVRKTGPEYYVEVQYGRIGRNPTKMLKGPFADRVWAEDWMREQAHAKRQKGYTPVKAVSQGLDALPDQGRAPKSKEIIELEQKLRRKPLDHWGCFTSTANRSLAGSAQTLLNNMHKAQGDFKRQVSAMERYVKHYRQASRTYQGAGMGDTAVRETVWLWLDTVAKKIGGYQLADVADAVWDRT